MKRILFVDDRQSVLDGLRRMLHRQRGEWGVEAELSAWREIAAELAEASGARAA